jgi:hypothetical protein
MEFNRLFPKAALDVLDQFPKNEPIVYDEEKDGFCLLDTSELRNLQLRLNKYIDLICTSPDTALRALALQHLLRVLFRDDFRCAFKGVAILDIATRGKVHDRALFVITELLVDLEAGRYSLLQLHEAAEDLKSKNGKTRFSLSMDDNPSKPLNRRERRARARAERSTSSERTAVS